MPEESTFSWVLIEQFLKKLKQCFNYAGHLTWKLSILHQISFPLTFLFSLNEFMFCWILKSIIVIVDFKSYVCLGFSLTCLVFSSSPYILPFLFLSHSASRVAGGGSRIKYFIFNPPCLWVEFVSISYLV